ncbi:unnamed protein product, partial [Amoebophrya sp. A25]
EIQRGRLEEDDRHPGLVSGGLIRVSNSFSRLLLPYIWLFLNRQGDGTPLTSASRDLMLLRLFKFNVNAEKNAERTAVENPQRLDAGGEHWGGMSGVSSAAEDAEDVVDQVIRLSQSLKRRTHEERRNAERRNAANRRRATSEQHRLEEERQRQPTIPEGHAATEDHDDGNGDAGHEVEHEEDREYDRRGREQDQEGDGTDQMQEEEEEEQEDRTDRTRRGSSSGHGSSSLRRDQAKRHKGYRSRSRREQDSGQGWGCGVSPSACVYEPLTAVHEAPPESEVDSNDGGARSIASWADSSVADSSLCGSSAGPSTILSTVGSGIARLARRSVYKEQRPEGHHPGDGKGGDHGRAASSSSRQCSQDRGDENLRRGERAERSGRGSSSPDRDTDSRNTREVKKLSKLLHKFQRQLSNAKKERSPSPRRSHPMYKYSGHIRDADSGYGGSDGSSASGSAC